MEHKTPKKRGRKRIKFTEDDLLKIEQASGMGLTNEQLANVLGCSLSTVRRNRKNNELFEHHVRKGRANSLKEVSNALYNNAVYENNVQAQIFFLKNRADHIYKDRQETVHATINLNDVLSGAKERIGGQMTDNKEPKIINAVKSIPTAREQFPNKDLKKKKGG